MADLGGEENLLAPVSASSALLGEAVNAAVDDEPLEEEDEPAAWVDEVMEDADAADGAMEALADDAADAAACISKKRRKRGLEK